MPWVEVTDPDAREVREIMHAVNAFARANTTMSKDEISDEALAVMLALGHLEMYRHTARRAMDRMLDAQREEAPSPGPRESPLVLPGARASDSELHIYLMAWAMVRRILGRVSRRTARLGMRSALTVWQRHEKLLQTYYDLRHHIEHFDERLPGAGDKAKDIYRRFVDPDNPAKGGLIGWNRDDLRILEIDNQSADVSSSSLARLESIVVELRADMLAEAREGV